jgi:sugar-specific transcriptional regulator TrmB
MNFESLSKTEQQEIVENLEQFGLGEKEYKIYLALLKFDKTTISPISKMVNLPLTTVQSVLIRLEKKGLVSVSSRKTRHVYEVKDPIIFKKLLERQLQEIDSVIPLLKKLKSETGSGAKIQIYQNERMTDIFHQALKVKNKQIFEIVSAKDFQNVLGEKFHFTKRRVQAGLSLKSLRVEKWEIKKYNKKIHEKELREAKFLPQELTFRASIMFWDDTVAFFSSKEDSLAWTVKSAVISEMMKQLFEMLWSISRRMETLPE